MAKDNKLIEEIINKMKNERYRIYSFRNNWLAGNYKELIKRYNSKK